jgi:hypothetical protein
MRRRPLYSAWRRLALPAAGLPGTGGRGAHLPQPLEVRHGLLGCRLGARHTAWWRLRLALRRVRGAGALILLREARGRARDARRLPLCALRLAPFFATALRGAAPARAARSRPTTVPSALRRVLRLAATQVLELDQVAPFVLQLHPGASAARAARRTQRSFLSCAVKIRPATRGNRRERTAAHVPASSVAPAARTIVPSSQRRPEP